VPVTHTDSALCFWVLRQKRLYQKGKLSEEKIAKLEELQFNWQHGRQEWNVRFLELKRFYRLYGDSFLPNLNEFKQLYRWVCQQRFQYKLLIKGYKSTLTTSRVQKLLSIDFCFEDSRQQESELWDKRWSELKRYKQVNGNCLVHYIQAENAMLGKWAKKQCFLNENNKLTADRKMRLEKLEVEWFRNMLSWDERYAQLQNFVRIHKNCLVPNTGACKSLYSWINNQRYQYRLYCAGEKSYLTKNRIKLLTDIGIVLDGKENMRAEAKKKLLWESRVNQLELYKRKFGDCHVPNHHPDFPKLGQWVRRQRTLFQKKELPQSLIDRLDAIGFEWERKRETWACRFKELKDHYEKFGNCDVPYSENNKALIGWIRQQRHQYRLYCAGEKSFLTGERIKALSTLSFFETDVAVHLRWKDRYEELLLYKEKNGNCLVPKSYSPNPSLAHWVENQRKEYRRMIAGQKSSMTSEKVSALEGIGFVWNPKDYEWEINFNSLRQAIKNPPKGKKLQKLSSLNPDLQKWVSKQQAQIVRCMNGRSCKLPKERIEALLKLQLPFLGMRFYSTWSERYLELVRYRAKYGHCNVPQHYPDDPALGYFVKAQRSQYMKMIDGKKSCMTLERAIMLETIGFQWSALRKVSKEDGVAINNDGTNQKAKQHMSENEMLLQQWRNRFQNLQTNRPEKL